MKIIILGAGGITTPLVVKSLLSHNSLDINEVVLFDTDPERLMISKKLIESLNLGKTKFIFAQDIRNYKGTLDVAIFSIRPGLELGRAADEKICRDLGLLANETTGAAGFSFSCRTVPYILEYARILTNINPNILFINFTNPAGIVTQALHDNGYINAVGVCSSADRIKRRVAEYFDIPIEQVLTNVFGLNHLSWTTQVVANGQDVLEQLIRDDNFLQLSQPWFPKEFIHAKKHFLNEYLYFYYFYIESIEMQEQKNLTRGEELERMNSNLRERLLTVIKQNNSSETKDTYMQYLVQRKGSYMAELVEKKLKKQQDTDEGYSGVAIGVIDGIYFKKDVRLSICTPLGIAYRDLRNTDIVEITSEIKNGVINPMPPAELSSVDYSLLAQVKEYERKTLDAIKDKSREKALSALNSHPLLKSVEKNDGFLHKIFNVHDSTFKDWR